MYIAICIDLSHPKTGRAACCHYVFFSTVCRAKIHHDTPPRSCNPSSHVQEYPPFDGYWASTLNFEKKKNVYDSASLLPPSSRVTTTNKYTNPESRFYHHIVLAWHDSSNSAG
ncbi:unnamed protein product [Ectocarpus sp. 13 AM-2016]